MPLLGCGAGERYSHQVEKIVAKVSTIEQGIKFNRVYPIQVFTNFLWIFGAQQP
jgi:hypothetical protein